MGFFQAALPHPRRPAEHPLVFELGGQSALIDNEMKILKDPSAGHCDRAKGSFGSGRTLLFNLSADPSESVDLSKSATHKSLIGSMQARLRAFQHSVKLSALQESQCATPPDGPGAVVAPHSRGIQPECDTPLKHWGHAPTPAPPPPTGRVFQLRAGGECLTAVTMAERASVITANCSTSTDGDVAAGLQNWLYNADGKLFLAGSALCVKPDYTGPSGKCAVGAPIWLGESQKNMFAAGESGTVQLAEACGEAKMCMVRSGGSGGALSLGLCSDPAAHGWVQRWT